MLYSANAALERPDPPIPLTTITVTESVKEMRVDLQLDLDAKRVVAEGTVKHGLELRLRLGCLYLSRLLLAHGCYCCCCISKEL